jgi:hypothetical protein
MWKIKIIIALLFISNTLLVQNDSEFLYQKLRTKIREPNFQKENIHLKPKQCKNIEN